MLKKSVIGGLMLSTSVIGIAGCSVPQKQAIVNDTKQTNTKNVGAITVEKFSNQVTSKNKPQLIPDVQPQENVVEAPVANSTVETSNDVLAPVIENTVNEMSAPTYQAEAVLTNYSDSDDVKSETAEQPVVEENVNVESTETPATEVTETENKEVSADVESKQEAPIEASNEETVSEEIPNNETVTPSNEQTVQDVVLETKVEEEQPVENTTVSEPEQPAPVVEEQPTAPQPVVETSSVQPETPQRPQYNTDASSYPVGQCTWGVKTVAPWVGDYWGNGGQWAASAARDGFRTGKTPQVGAVASWDDGGYGHVAYVTDVDPATGYVKVVEANYNGNQSIGDHRGWFDASNPMWGNVTYIYQN